MSDEWEFRTATGRARVADGRLRVSGSVRGLLGKRWREKWTRKGSGRRLLFVASLVGTILFLSDAVQNVRAVLTGDGDLLSLFVLGALGFLVLTVAYWTSRTRSVDLRAITEVRRVDDDRLRVEYDDGERDKLDIETPTEREAEEAVELLRLRGVKVEDSTDNEVSSSEFRRRLRAKRE